MARAAVECAYAKVRGLLKGLMGLRGKGMEGISRRAGVVVIVEVCTYICVLDGCWTGW